MFISCLEGRYPSLPPFEPFAFPFLADFGGVALEKASDYCCLIFLIDETIGPSLPPLYHLANITSAG